MKKSPKKTRNTATVTVSMPPELLAAIREAAAKEDRTVSSWCVHYLNKHLPKK